FQATTAGGVSAVAGRLAAQPLAGAAAADRFEPIRVPDWVRGVTRMAFITPGDVARAAESGVQVAHANMVWPYFPLRRDGGGLSAGDGKKLHAFVDDCHHRGMK